MKSLECCLFPSAIPRSAPFLPMGKEGDGTIPVAFLCPLRSPGVPGLSPALFQIPGKDCGKLWLLLVNKLPRGWLCFSQGLIMCMVLSRCSDPIPPLDLRAGAQASPPGPTITQWVSFPFPQHTVPLFPAAIHHGKARDLPAFANPVLLQSSLPSLPSPTPAQGKIDQCVFMDGLNAQKKGGKKEMLP